MVVTSICGQPALSSFRQLSVPYPSDLILARYSVGQQSAVLPPVSGAQCLLDVCRNTAPHRLKSGQACKCTPPTVLQQDATQPFGGSAVAQLAHAAAEITMQPALLPAEYVREAASLILDCIYPRGFSLELQTALRAEHLRAAALWLLHGQHDNQVRLCNVYFSLKLI